MSTSSSSQPTTSSTSRHKTKQALPRRAVSMNVITKQNDANVTDLTPPSSDSTDENCPSKKSLFASSEACAMKSLKRLSCERKIATRLPPGVPLVIIDFFGF